MIVFVGSIALAVSLAADALPPPLAPNMKPTPAGDPARWFSPDNYPPAALRASRQGRVVVDIAVDSAGRPVTCTVEVSSGTAVLDSGTCDVALAQARFDPATDARGKPTAGNYRLPVRWSIPETAPAIYDATRAADYTSDITIEYRIDAQGNLLSCRVLSGQLAKAANGDPFPPGRIGQHMTVPWQRDGRPVGVTLVRREAQSISVDP